MTASVASENEMLLAKTAGAHAARTGQELTRCPYKGDGQRARVLARLWLRGYREVIPLEGGVVDYDDAEQEPGGQAAGTEVEA